MMEDNNKEIKAKNVTIRELMEKKKFRIDFFQREYKWQKKHITELLEDLTNNFFTSFKDEDERGAVEFYKNYYLGPVVFDKSKNVKSIIDGQQRITSLTLLLIYLNHLQKQYKCNFKLNDYIHSEKFGQLSFNMVDEYREECLRSLYTAGEYKLKELDNETIQNMVERYQDIVENFPESINEKVLPYFIDWLTEKVILVEITTETVEDAYIVFETMNDRGLNLSPVEMLKGYVLSKIDDLDKRTEINELWKKKIQDLNNFSENADLSFVQAWFRAKYAETIRPGKVNSENKDYEIISTRPHNWFRDNAERLGIISSNDFYDFFKYDFDYYSSMYIKIWNSINDYNIELDNLIHLKYWGIAASLQEILLLSSIHYTDTQQEQIAKIQLVAKFIEAFAVKRAINYRKFSHSSIKYSMFKLTKEIRNKDYQEVLSLLKSEIESMDCQWYGATEFSMHGQNKRFTKHLLCRITSHLDKVIGKTSSYIDYMEPEKGKKFEIEHIWANKIERYPECKDESSFKFCRNHIGALLLLENGTNQSYGDDPYGLKVRHYLKTNTYAQSLHQDFYTKNPNFKNNKQIIELEMKPHLDFKKKDIFERAQVVEKICEQIWKF